MEKEKKIFTVFCTGVTLSFLLCGYSLVMCFVYGTVGGLGTYILEISYLFLHLFATALLFYLGFRAIKLGSFFTRSLMFDDEGMLIKWKKWLFLALSILFFLLGVYSILQIAGLNLPLSAQIGVVVWHDLMNGFILLSIVFITFFLYSFVPWELRDNRKHM